MNDEVQLRQGRIATVGTKDVMRVLPTKGRRTVGGWCFVDMMVPGDELDPDPLEIGPHPHIGLSTVTWLFHGEAVHSDSLGTELAIRPGQLNLMTAGRGIAHAELSSAAGVVGTQMWIAQPEHTRHGESRFEQVRDLPIVDLAHGEATVFIGELEQERSSAVVDSPLVGAELRLAAGASQLEAKASFEYAVIPIDHPVLCNGAVVEPGWIGVLPAGVSSTVEVESRHGGGRALLIGGEPLGERIQMWWNFVARTRDELTSAWHDWQAGDTDRFPEFRSTLDRIEAPTPFWVDASTSF